MSKRTCRHGPIWSHCGRQAISQCVFCGQAFCDAHGRRGVDGLDVCQRSRCVSKVSDLDSHRQYLEVVDAQNRVGLCGLSGCEDRYSASCSSCQRFYCPEHVLPREDVAAISGERYIAACDHCWERRKLWRRRG